MINDSLLSDLYLTYPAICGAPTSLREQIRGNARPAFAPPNHVLATPGCDTDALLLLTHGTISVELAGRAARSLVVYDVRPGDVCVLSVVCLQTRRPFPARARSVGESQGVLFSRDLFEALQNETPEFCRFVFGRVCARACDMFRLIDDLAFGNVDARLAKLLLEQPYPIRTTHQLLAARLGAAREVVSRTLKGFETRGCLSLRRGEICVVDDGSLRQIAMRASNGNGGGRCAKAADC
ncbi:MAG: Crp/Fnr family transcriptional regulator [Phycisphaerae bacterium]